VRLAWRTCFLIGMTVASRAETLSALEPSPVRVGIRNDLKIPVLVIGLTPGAGASIRLVPGETVWERLPAQSRRPLSFETLRPAGCCYRPLYSFQTRAGSLQSSVPPRITRADVITDESAINSPAIPAVGEATRATKSVSSCNQK
jgi:hypothetical protein